MDPLELLSFDKHPDEILVITGDAEYTRRKLHRRAAAVGNRLKGMDLGPSKCVIVSLDSGDYFVAGLLGCWLAGVTPVLLDPLLKRELASAIEMTGSRVLIRMGEGGGDLPEGTQKLSLDREEADPYPAPPVGQDEPLVYLFTSGSTGSPTLVPKSFVNLHVEIVFLNRLFDSPKRVATMVPWCHIFGFIVSFLTTGNRGGLCDLSGGISPKRVLERAGQGMLDLVVAVPAVYRVMIQYLEAGDLPPIPPSCRFVTSGALLDSSLREQFYSLTGCQLSDLYGSTEAGGVAHREDDGPWILQPHVEMRINGDGFLEVRSESVSFGATDEFYSMGDLIRLEGRGFVLEGRKDDVVKIGGKRVALGEVQSVMEQCPLVMHAAVLMEKVRGVNRIVSFIEPISGDVTPQSINAFVRERLADHKVPRVIHIIEKMPRTPAGKVDRRKLQSQTGKKER
jgi:acyl-coenzyme A synthetase/AMP-(fatty) acid ligase